MARYDLPGHPLGRKISQIILAILIRLFLRVQLTDSENIPPTGPAIIVINHISILDPVVVCNALAQRVIPLAKKEAFSVPIIGFLMKLYGTIPVQRGEADLLAIKTALRVLKTGKFLLLAPEGTRSPTHQLQPAKEGAVIFALRSGAPIIPIGVAGTEAFVPHLFRLQRAPIYISVGKPFYLARSRNRARLKRNETAEMLGEVMYRLAAQLPEPYRGVYAKRHGATETHILPPGEISVSN